MVKPQTLKGFRDFLPKEARKRQYAINTLKQVFESYGFEPLETPALEYEEILLGKYGQEGDKLMYRFIDRGSRKVALRYDQTVPLARVIAQYGNELPMPFKRYQIQNVWRAENPQKGRFREFLQCDADIIGSSSPLSDAETILVAAKSIEKLGFEKFKVLINDRNSFSQLVTQGLCEEKELPVILRTIDKLKKIGKEKVLEELTRKGVSKNQATSILSSIDGRKPTQQLNKILSYLKELVLKNSRFEFSPTLARGLDYYTGMIFEIEIGGYSAGSVCGGGRYDNLIGLFSKKSLPAGRQEIPAVGFAFGFDRLIEAMTELRLFPTDLTTTKILVTIFSKEFMQQSFNYSTALRSAGVSTELYLDENASLEKQLKYADKKGIPFVIIIGRDEAKNNTVTIKNMQTRKQKAVEKSDLPKFLSNP